MTKSCLICGGALLLATIALSSGLMGCLAVPARADDAPALVELDCKIVSAKLRSDPWLVEIRRPNGEPVRILSGMGNSTIRIKNLGPGIYTVCVLGSENRQHCESVDLTLPPGKRSARFKKDFMAPEHVLHAADLNRVSRQRLAVPDKAREELTRAEQFQLHGDPEQSARHLERAIEIAPTYTDALNNLGTYYHRKGKYEKSIEYFGKVTELEPDYYGGWVNLAGSLLAVGEFHQALAANRRAYRIRPNDIVVISQLALNCYYLHDLSEAKKQFLRLLRMDPASAISPQLYLVHIALAEKNKDEAADYIKAFLSIHPNAPEASHLRDTLANLDSIIFEAEYAQTKQ